MGGLGTFEILETFGNIFFQKEEAMRLIREYLAWSDKLPSNIAEYDPKLEEFNIKISQHF